MRVTSLFVILLLLVVPACVNSAGKAVGVLNQKTAVVGEYALPSNFHTPSGTKFATLPYSATFSASDSEFPVVKEQQLKIPSDIYGLSMDAEIQLFTPTSLVRLISVDASGKETLIYEAYPLIGSPSSFRVTGVCEETCVLPRTTSAMIRAEVEDAQVKITKISYTTSPQTSPTAVSLKQNQDAHKISMMNKVIADNKLHWLAGETSVSRRSYAEKKKMFLQDPSNKDVPVLPNLQGFDFYRGGIYELLSSQKQTAPLVTGNVVAPPPGYSKFPDTFDWRDMHGADWLTPVKDQGDCRSCGVMSSTSAVELLTNLYYNRHLDLDLSEQHVLACFMGPGVFSGACERGVWDWEAYNFMSKSPGIIDEGCFPYVDGDMYCEDHNKCSSPDQEITISDYGSIELSSEPEQRDEEMKEALITHGAVVLLYRPITNHYMHLIGYSTVKEGDILHISDNFKVTTYVPPGDALIGHTYWIVKNSFGTDWGDNGFAKIIPPATLSHGQHYNLELSYPTPPINSHLPDVQYDILCTDTDNDGYCYWGITDQKPSDCPTSCSAQDVKDCNDANPYLSTDCSLSVSCTDSDLTLGQCNSYYVNQGVSCVDLKNKGEVDITLSDGDVVSRKSDRCMDDVMLEEYACKDGKMDVKYALSCPGLGGICKDGACEENTGCAFGCPDGNRDGIVDNKDIAPIGIYFNCKESDPTSCLSPWERAIIADYDVNKWVNVADSVCIGMFYGQKVEDNPVLKENCAKVVLPPLEEHNCTDSDLEYGCDEGTNCINSYYYGIASNGLETRQDTCNPAGDTLYEVYCNATDNKPMVGSAIPCHCVNGACVP